MEAKPEPNQRKAYAMQVYRNCWQPKKKAKSTQNKKNVGDKFQRNKITGKGIIMSTVNKLLAALHILIQHKIDKDDMCTQSI